MSKLPFYKPSLGQEEIDEVVDTLKSGWLTTGPKTKQFEQEFSAYLKHRHSVAVNSCTAALHLALEAIGLQPGQGVIVPTMTFAATAEVVRYLGGRPILADCRADDFNLDTADAERKIQSALAAGQSVSAVMPVHYGGQIGDVAGVRALAGRYHLKIVEDAAHCCPAFYRESESAPWQTVGSSADVSCYSFYANKTITTGEGGMACSNDEACASRMRMMSLHGISHDAWKRFTDQGSWYYEILAPGFKYNMTDIAAAIGIHQLRKAGAFHQRRTAIAGQYQELLRHLDEIILPQVQPNRIHSWHLYVIRLKLERLRIDRAQFIVELRNRGVNPSVHWMPLHMHPYYRQTLGLAAEDLPMAASLYPQIITLPLYPDMGEAGVRQVCGAIEDIVRSNRRA
ncbi:MAG TPA: DegT/DnrJ/EryC1/StrS aminotransferase family protein [Verrucomicrobiae bacterium]|jgi:perosamine synthetase